MLQVPRKMSDINTLELQEKLGSYHVAKKLIMDRENLLGVDRLRNFQSVNFNSTTSSISTLSASSSKKSLPLNRQCTNTKTISNYTDINKKRKIPICDNMNSSKKLKPLHSSSNNFKKAISKENNELNHVFLRKQTRPCRIPTSKKSFPKF